MSRFIIYQINHYDPQIFGRQKRRLLIIFAGITFIFMLVLQIMITVFHIEILLFFSISFPLILVSFLYLRSKLKPDFKKIKTIGDIEFTKNCIKKRIGDSQTEYNYLSIKQIELQKHLPEVTSTNVTGDYFSYILKIEFLNSSSESLVISSKPADQLKSLSILDTMRTLKKLIKAEILIK